MTIDTCGDQMSADQLVPKGGRFNVVNEISRGGGRLGMPRLPHGKLSMPSQRFQMIRCKVREFDFLAFD